MKPIASYIVRIIFISVVIMFAMSCDKKTDTANVNIISVDAFARNPEQYNGYIGIAGPVTGKDDSSHLFGIGCKDACFVIPVKFMGNLPRINTNVVVYGVLKSQDGRYFFDASKVEGEETKW